MNEEEFNSKIEESCANLEAILRESQKKLFSLFEEQGSTFYKDKYLKRVNAEKSFLTFIDLFNKNVCASVYPGPHERKRLLVKLGTGLVAKVLPTGYTIKNTKFLSLYSGNAYYLDKPKMFRENNLFPDEHNYNFLDKYGFTDKFTVPKHKLARIIPNNGDPKVISQSDSYNIVLSEDLSVGGYEVTDIYPHYFYALENKKEFFDSYVNQMDSLLSISKDERFIIAGARHTCKFEGNDNVFPVSRTLLARIKDNIGKIIIGDLNNIVFIEKSALENFQEKNE
ncbi:MAG: hypothetical protein Q8O89_07325 [Nanoarchaeota archaeon]|nr:hypothetical protein [Nanoarchaeota archaeon]